MTDTNAWFPNPDTNEADWPAPEPRKVLGVDNTVNAHIAGSAEFVTEPTRGSRKTGTPTRDFADYRPAPTLPLAVISAVMILAVGAYIWVLAQAWATKDTLSSSVTVPDISQSVSDITNGGAGGSVLSLAVTLLTVVLMAVIVFAIPCRLLGPVVKLWQGSKEALNKTRVNAAILLLIGVLIPLRLTESSGTSVLLDAANLPMILGLLFPFAALVVSFTQPVKKYASRRLGPTADAVARKDNWAHSDIGEK